MKTISAISIYALTVIWILFFLNENVMRENWYGNWYALPVVATVVALVFVGFVSTLNFVERKNVSSKV